uniref:Uncharacterized protein n=1 Tax=Plectus sambesii TaxID=2011161 RepID=A0A914XDE4_9BILA
MTVVKECDRSQHYKSDGEDEEKIVLREKREQKRSVRSKMSTFIRKYFFEGQRLANEKQAEIYVNNPDDSFFEVFIRKHRKLLGFVIPMSFFYIVWWSIAIRYNLLPLFPERYEMSITMMFGGLIAGMTCEGGGAVAFPVMTLALQIDPIIARDFSLMIQSCGMTAAAFTILFMRIAIEWRSIVFGSVGAIFGVTFGLEFVDPHLTADQKKMGFVSIWFAFALALFLLNTQKKRTTFERIVDFNWWKAVVLTMTGFVGGIVTSFSGSGVDICSFSMLTLLFRISEKVATPTSVVLMACNTVVGFYWRQIIMTDVSLLAWEYWTVCIPVVVIMAPFGSVLASHFHRLVLATFIYVLEIIALISGFLVVKPDWTLTAISFGIILGGFAFFYALTRIGSNDPVYDDAEEEGDNSLELKV